MSSFLRVLPIVLASLAFTSCAGHTLSKEEKTGDIYEQGGVSALREGRFAEALGSLENAVKYKPKDPYVWTNLGLAYLNKGDAASAERCWKKALTLDPNFTGARLNMGGLYVQQGRWADAERVLKKASEDLAYPNQHQVFFNLAMVYFHQDRPLAAEQQLQLAVNHMPNFCEGWYRLAGSQAGRGATQAAINSYNNAVKGTCFREFPDAHLAIGNLLMQEHQTARAKAKLVEIMQLFPDTEWARKAELSLNVINK